MIQIPTCDRKLSEEQLALLLRLFLDAESEINDDFRKARNDLANTRNRFSVLKSTGTTAGTMPSKASLASSGSPSERGPHRRP